MQRTLGFLVPDFLKRLDRYLLLYHPRWWATKSHYVIFYGVLANIFFVLITLLFIRPYQLYSFITSFVVVSILFEIGIFIYWLYSQSLFNIEQDYGRTHYAVGFIETIIYTICTIFIFSPSLMVFFIGMYKTAYYLEVKNHNLCEGPILVSFLSDYDFQQFRNLGYDTNKMQAALGLAEDAINTGKVQNVIGIDYTIFAPLAREQGILVYTGNYTRDNAGTLVVSSSEALVILYSGTATVKHQGEIITMQSGELTQVFAGDEITYSGAYRALYVNSGTLTVVPDNTIKVPRDDAIIVRQGEGIKLIQGETTVQVESGIWRFQALGSYGTDTHDVCENVITFVKNIRTYDPSRDVIGFYAILAVVLSFIILGVFLVAILKHTNWRILIFSFLYLLISFTVVLILSSIFSNLLSVDIGILDVDANNIPTVIVTVALTMFILIESARLIRTKKYKQFAFINFVSLPIAFGVLVFILQTSQNDSNPARVALALAVFFLVCLLFTPIQKKMLIYLMSLPTE